MNKEKWNEGLNHIDSDLVEEFVEKSEKLEKRKRRQSILFRFGALAACFCLVISAFIVIPMLRGDEPGTVQHTEITAASNSPSMPVASSSPGMPAVRMQVFSAAPQYYGSGGSEAILTSDTNSAGLSVTAQLVEILPDTYTFFDDWSQYEFRLLKMKTVMLLKGLEMTEEFYYMIPVDFMTDFSAFDKFVILNMAQFGYEYSVMYNKTHSKAEQLELVLFGYRNYGHYFMGENFMAFDSEGNFDKRLWNSSEAWITNTEHAETVATIIQAEERARQDKSYNDLGVHLLKDVAGEAADVLSHVKSFENGIYVPESSGWKLFLSPEVQFHAVRYVNGFATNEKVSVWSKEWSGRGEDTFAVTKAQFDEKDMDALPDLANAITSVAAAYNKGEITPPHIVNAKDLELLVYGIFGWYAKATNGVVGIVRVTWRYTNGALDDAYYIIEHGMRTCRSIDRDTLLEKLGEYEKTYIYLGEYAGYGKVYNHSALMS